MGKKTLLALALAAAAALGTTSSAMAAAASSTDVTDFTANITKAKLVLEGLLPDGLEVDPAKDPVLAGKSIKVTGTISKGGKVSVAPSGFDFPEVDLSSSLDIPAIKDVLGDEGKITADIVLVSPSTGSLNTTTKAFSLPLSLGVQLTATTSPALGDLKIQCLVSPLAFNFTTGDVTGWTLLVGTPWTPTGFGLTGQSALPSLASLSNDQCNAAVKGLAGGAIPAGTKVGLKLEGATTIGTSYKKPAVGSLSGSANVTVAKGKNVTSAVKVKCAGTASKNRACTGTISLVLASKDVTLSTPFSVNPGKTGSITLPVSNDQKAALGTKKVTGKVNVVVDNGTGALNKAGSVLVKK